MHIYNYKQYKPMSIFIKLISLDYYKQQKFPQ